MKRTRLSRKMKIAKKRMPRIEFAPDGIHYQTIKSGSIGKMYDYFATSPEIREQLLLNHQAKFRFIGEEKVIGTMRYNRLKRGIETVVEHD